MKLTSLQRSNFQVLMVFTDLDFQISFGLNVGIYFGINMNVLKNEGIDIKKQKLQRSVFEALK